MDFRKIVDYVEEHKAEYFEELLNRKGSDNMTETKTNLISDETLGGVQREYIEVERKAVVGDYVLITYFEHMNVSNIVEVTDLYGDDFYFTPEILSDGGEPCSFFDGNSEKYTTIEPTDTVHIDGERFKLVERKAGVGEKVLVVSLEDSIDYVVGEVFTVEKINEDVVFITDSAGDENGLYHSEYCVLIPVAPSLSELLAECTPGNRHEEVFVDSSQCSEAVLDMLANLARRVTELERENKRITQDLGWHEFGPGRIANLRISVSDLKHDVAKLEAQTESNTQDIADLDDRTQSLVEPKQAAEALLRKIAKLIEEEGVGI